jgi:hypothetical protein
MQDSAQRPGNRLYALLTPDGLEVINSVGLLPDGVWDEPGLARLPTNRSARTGNSATAAPSFGSSNCLMASAL